MGWQMAVVGALGYAQYKQQGAIGKFNQAVQNRNAEVAEQQGEQIDKKLEFDIAQFDKEFKKIEGQQRTATAKSGTTFEGTAVRIARMNAEEAALQRNVLRYNAQVQKTQAIERANMFRIQGQVARQQAKAAQIQTIASTGKSLMSLSGGGSPSSTQQPQFFDTSGYQLTPNVSQ